MKYIMIIIILGLSLPATAMVSTESSNTPKERMTVINPKKSTPKAEDLRKIIQKKTGYKICNPDEELKMPTFY